MSRLKLGPIADDKPVRLKITLSAELHRLLASYAKIYGQQTGQGVEPAKLIPAMLERFMNSDRTFARARKVHFDGGPAAEA